MKKDTEDLTFPRGCALMKDITEAEYRELCVWLKARECHLLNRQPLVRESDPCKWIGVVLSGAIRLTRSRMDGGSNVLETVAPNDTFGATYVFRGQPTMGIGMSAVGETQVIVFDVGNMLECGHVVKLGHLKFLRNLLTVMSQKTFQIKQKLRILSQRTIRGRLLLLLNILAKRAKSLEFDIPFDRQSLADYLCVERSALSNEISKLRREGRIESTRNHFRMICHAAVAALMSLAAWPGFAAGAPRDYSAEAAFVGTRFPSEPVVFQVSFR